MRLRYLITIFLLTTTIFLIPSTSASVTATWSFPVIDGTHSAGEWSFHAQSLSLYELSGTNSTPVAETVGMEVGFANNNDALCVTIKILDTLLPTGGTDSISAILVIDVDDGVSRPGFGNVPKRGDHHSTSVQYSGGQIGLSSSYDSVFSYPSPQNQWILSTLETVLLTTTDAALRFSSVGTPGEPGDYLFETNFTFGNNNGRYQDLNVSSSYRVSVFFGLYVTQPGLSNDYDATYCWPADTYHDYDYFDASLFNQWYEVIPSAEPPPAPIPGFPPLTVLLAVSAALGLGVLVRRRK